MSRYYRVLRLLSIAFVAVAAGGCVGSPEAEAKRQEQMLQVGDAVNELRNINDEMRITLDSLRIVVAKQDSTLARLANVTGVIVVK